MGLLWIFASFLTAAFAFFPETATPICAKDISDDLMKEFAFLSGEYGELLQGLSLCAVIKYSR